MPETASDPRIEKLKDELARATTKHEIERLEQKLKILESRK